MEKTTLPISNHKDWQTVLRWANQFKYCSYFTGNDSDTYPYGGFPNSMAIGNQLIPIEEAQAFESVESYFNNQDENEPLYGYFAYDLFEETHHLKSKHSSKIKWPKALFFKAHTILTFEDECIKIESIQLDIMLESWNLFLSKPVPHLAFLGTFSTIKTDTSKDEYISTVNKLKQHIEEGDVYEINFCINNFTTTKDFNPLIAFYRLTEKSKSPFSTFLKLDQKYVICASPERFIKSEGDKIISQPIKGTAKRSNQEDEDEQLKKDLFHSEKERAENMMIVDLVRNDLSQSAEAGTVKVEELFGIYSFKYVHQMISTITAKRRPTVTAIQAIKNAFPMGSMTGAPKKSAIELIEKYEKCSRGIFSGCIGYFQSKNVFDFNVVIRSVFYDHETNQLNYQIGSAITYDSDAEEEYNECQLKAQAIEEMLKS